MPTSPQRRRHARFPLWLVFSLLVLGPIGAWQAFLAGRSPRLWGVGTGLMPFMVPVVLIFMPSRPAPTREEIKASRWPRLGLYMLIALLSTLLVMVVVFATLSQVPGLINAHSLRFLSAG